MHTMHKRFFFDNLQAQEVCWLDVISVRKMMCTGLSNAFVNANPSVSHSLIHITGHLLTPPVCCRSRSTSDASDLCNLIASGSIFHPHSPDRVGTGACLSAPGGT